VLECPLCDRACPDNWLEDHHLKTRRKDKHDTKLMCKDCHKTIHGLFSNRALRDKRTGLDTIEGLLENPRFQAALVFIKKLTPGTFMKMRRAKGVR